MALSAPKTTTTRHPSRRFRSPRCNRARPPTVRSCRQHHRRTCRSSRRGRCSWRRFSPRVVWRSHVPVRFASFLFLRLSRRSDDFGQCIDIAKRILLHLYCAGISVPRPFSVFLLRRFLLLEPPCQLWCSAVPLKPPCFDLAVRAPCAEQALHVHATRSGRRTKAVHHAPLLGLPRRTLFLWLASVALLPFALVLALTF